MRPLHPEVRHALGEQAEGTAPVEATCACCSESAANTCWVSGSQARLVAQPEAKLRTWEGARFIGHAVPRLARGLSSAPMISMTQIGPRYGRRNSLRSPNLGGAMSMLKHAALLTLSSSTRPDSHIFVLVRAPEPTPRSASFAPLSIVREVVRLLQASGGLLADMAGREGHVKVTSLWHVETSGFFRCTFQGKAIELIRR